eukprot:7549531-Lingulodinium_polyedra.AAC.2
MHLTTGLEWGCCRSRSRLPAASSACSNCSRCSPGAQQKQKIMVDVTVSSMDSHKETRFALLSMYPCHVSRAAGARGTLNSPKASRQLRGRMEWNM